MNSRQPVPPFAAQRIICIALLLGMFCYAVVVAVLLQQQGWQGISEAPIEILDTVVMAAGSAILVTAIVVRSALRGRAAAAPAATRALLTFQATLIPVAILEGGTLLAITVWMLNGNAIPHVIVAAVLFAVAVVFVPFTDPLDGTNAPD